MDKVLVTGGSGFIALHCIDQLLGKGYAVRTTIRSESRIDEIASLISGTKITETARKVASDLLQN